MSQLVPTQFRHVALIGKYHGSTGKAARDILLDIARFWKTRGLRWRWKKTPPPIPVLQHYASLDVEGIGAQCDLGLVVGGDGTMLGIGRQLARFGVPLIGINQGRLGFITDIALESYQSALGKMLAGEYEEDSRSLMHAQVMRDGRCVFDALAMNDVVVNRGAISGMVELRVEVDGRFVANQRADGLIIASSTGLYRLCHVRRRAHFAPLHCGLGDGADCPAHLIQSASGAFQILHR